MSSRGPFGFVQIDFAHELGPPDGRYLVRGPFERVVVLGTLAAPAVIRRRFRRPAREDQAPEVQAPLTRVTVSGTEPPDDADAWLELLRSNSSLAQAEVGPAVAALTRLVAAHRVAFARPRSWDPDLEHAVALRIGIGPGNDVAEGRFTAGFELPRPAPGARADALDRFAAMVAGREQAPAGAELVLRTRADLDAGRDREACLQARIALEAVLADASRLDPELRAELEGARASVGSAANAALRGAPDEEAVTPVAAATAAMERALRSGSTPG